MTDSGQSPIDIQTGDLARSDLPPLRFEYPDAAEVFPCCNVLPGDLIDGKPRAVPLLVATPKPRAASLHVDGETYRLIQFHWHSPAEHFVDGAAAPMELHLVHQHTQDDSLLVVGVFYEEGPVNDAIAPIFASLDRFHSVPCADPVPLDLAALLPSTTESYRYPGSLTGADSHGIFKAGVSWVVLAQSVTVSAEQLAAHRALIDTALTDLHFPGRDGFDLGRPNPPGNARACQPLAERAVLTDVSG